MIGVVDYGAGNLQSVGNALDHLGVTWQLVESDADFERCDRAILPGVGHFQAAIQTLVETNQDRRISAFAATGKPLLGICLGAQLLLETSEESPGLTGLGLLPGGVTRLKCETVPHMGWNRVRSNGVLPNFGDDLQGTHFYFAHSYVCEPQHLEHCLAVTDCGTQKICVAVGCDNVMGVQFHPEKSGAAGLQLLERFAQC
jgi:glutamine amidotransferase